MNDPILAATLGALAGVLPVVATRLAGWLETRTLENKRRRSLELARGHIDFLDSWLKLQERLLEPDALKDIRTATSRELDHLKQTILELSARDESPYIALRERHWIQRLLLAYRPLRTSGWFYRLPYYMLIGVFVAVTLDLIRTREMFTGVDESGEFSFAYLAGEIIGGAIFIVGPLLLTWYFVNRTERRAEESLQSAERGG